MVDGGFGFNLGHSTSDPSFPAIPYSPRLLSTTRPNCLKHISNLRCIKQNTCSSGKQAQPRPGTIDLVGCNLHAWAKNNLQLDCVPERHQLTESACFLFLLAIIQLRLAKMIRNAEVGHPLVVVLLVSLSNQKKTQTNGQTDRQTDRQTDKQTGRSTQAKKCQLQAVALWASLTLSQFSREQISQAHLRLSPESILILDECYLEKHNWLPCDCLEHIYGIIKRYHATFQLEPAFQAPPSPTLS